MGHKPWRSLFLDKAVGTKIRLRGKQSSWLPRNHWHEFLYVLLARKRKHAILAAQWRDVKCQVKIYDCMLVCILYRSWTWLDKPETYRRVCGNPGWVGPVRPIYRDILGYCSRKTYHIQTYRLGCEMVLLYRNRNANVSCVDWISVLLGGTL
jgi:hypothetical protein